MGLGRDLGVAVGCNFGINAKVEVVVATGMGDGLGIAVAVGSAVEVGEILISLPIEFSTFEYPTISSPKNNRLAETKSIIIKIIPARYLMNQSAQPVNKIIQLIDDFFWVFI